MATPLVIVGAGGFGREVADVIAAQNASMESPGYDLLGFVDSGPSDVNLERLRQRSMEYLGTESDWLEAGRLCHFIVGVGKPDVRRAISERFEQAGHTPAVAVHPHATIGSIGLLGAGSVVCAGAQLSTNVVLGRHVHINPSAVVGHDTILGDFVSLNPGSIISGEVTVEDVVLVGAGAVVLQGLRLGAGSLIGAAACVTRSVEPGRTVKGVPAR